MVRNPVEGAKWLLKAAEQGNVQAQGDLGVMYQNGIGVAQSYQEALKWYCFAAQQGDAIAQHNLGSLNAKGIRLKQSGFFDWTRFAFMRATNDFVEAYKWFSLAARNGHSDSLHARAVIQRCMATAQIEKAEQLVQDLEREAKAALGFSTPWIRPMSITRPS